MRNKFLSIFVALFAFAFLAAHAQPVIEFKNETHDFGNITEGVNAVHEFAFKNTGKEPLIISAVNASCGCTTPFWTKEPIMPGKTGVIKASYNSQGRPETFNKSISVQSNASEPSKVLFIKGVVVKEEVKPVYTAEQLAKSPVISFAKAVQNVGKVEIGQTVNTKFNFTNTGKSPLEVNQISSPCNCIIFETSKSKLMPGESAVLELKYTPRSKNQEEEITVFTNDLKNGKTKFTLKAEVVEAASNQSILKESKAAVPFK